MGINNGNGFFHVSCCAKINSKNCSTEGTLRNVVPLSMHRSQIKKMGKDTKIIMAVGGFREMRRKKKRKGGGVLFGYLNLGFDQIVHALMV